MKGLAYPHRIGDWSKAYSADRRKVTAASEGKVTRSNRAGAPVFLGPFGHMSPFSQEGHYVLQRIRRAA